MRRLPPRMFAARRPVASLAALIALSATMSACTFKPPGEGREAGKDGIKEGRIEAAEEAVREGVAIELEGLAYTVFVTRQLNPQDPEDRGYYQGPPPPPGSALYGVFMKVCNDGDATAMAAGRFKVADTQGSEFEPVEPQRDNVFAYQPSRLPVEQCIPNALSLAAQGPTSGAVLIFQLPISATENRPIELEIEPPSGRGATAKIELDI